VARSATGRRGLSLAAMVLSSGSTSMPTAAVVLALPQIRTEFDASTADLAWVVTAFNLAYAALLVAFGRQADQFGRRRFFVAGTGLFIGAAVLGALAPNVETLIVAMALLGVASAAVGPASLAIVAQAFPTEERGKAVGAWGGASGVVSAVGPTLGGLLTQADWRLVFWVLVPWGAAILGLALLATPESRDEGASHRLDPAGFLTLVAGLTGLTLALIQGPTWGWESPTTIGLLAGSLAALGAFVVVERRVRAPLLRLGLFAKRNFAGANLVLFVMNFALAGALFLLPLWMQEYLGDSPLKAGLLLLPLSAGLAVAVPVGGWIADRTGPKLPILGGTAVMIGGLLWLWRIDPSTTYSDVWPALALVGIGIGAALTPMNLAGINDVSRAEAGTASGLLITMSGLGATFGVACSTAVFQGLFLSRTQADALAAGVHLTDAQASSLDGLLSGTSTAKGVLGGLDPAGQAAATAAAHDAFVTSIASAMLLMAVVGVVGLVLAAVIMRGAPAAVGAEKPVGPHVGAVADVDGS
jgi:EmrB/QacA subfamily drug resistance transporter